MNRTKSAVALASALSFSLIAACGGGVHTAAANATPTPGQTHTPTPTPNSSPTPTATGTPSAETMTCSFVWATSYLDVDGTFDFYEVDIAGSKFANTTNAFLADMSVAGYFISGYDPNTGDILYGAGMSIDGAIAMTAAGTAIGDAVTFNDTADHTFYDAYDYFTGASTQLGGAIATGGTGSFTGNLSDPDPNAPIDAGTGTIDATDGNATETFGGTDDGTGAQFDYAVCSQNA